jgi:hypothetical protein
MQRQLAVCQSPCDIPTPAHSLPRDMT